MTLTRGTHRLAPSRRTVLKSGAAFAAALACPTYLRAQNATLKIGMPSIFSGRVAILGETALAGLQLVVDEVNEGGGIDGRMLEIVTRDSRGKPDEGARMTRDLVNNEGCEVIINAEASGASFAINETVRDIRKYCIHSVSETSSLTADPANRIPWAFRVCRQGIHDAVGGGLYAAEVAKADGLTRWATCSPDYAYGRDNTEQFMAYTRKFAPDVEIVEQTWPKIFQPDYTENITALLNAQPQAIYSCLWGGDLVAFIDQASLYGLLDQFQAFAVNLSDYPVISAVKNLPGGMHSGSRYHKDVPDTEANEAWYEKFTSNNSVLPTQWSWATNAAGWFLVEALKKTGGDTDTEKLAEATTGMTIDSPFGVDGTLTLREGDNTLIHYPVGYGRTITEEPYVTDFQTSSWDDILPHEAEWKAENGYS